MLVAISVSCLTNGTAAYPVHNANIIYRVNHSAHIQAIASQTVIQSTNHSPRPGPGHKKKKKKKQQKN